MGSLLAVAPSTALDLKRAQLLLKTMPKEFAASVATSTEDVADGVADTVKANVPRGTYLNVYGRLAGWVTTGTVGRRTSKTRYIVELRVSPRGLKFSGFGRPNPTYPPAGMAYWYEFGSKHSPQLPPYTAAGYWVTPTLDRNAPDIYDAWLAGFVKALAAWDS